MARAKSVDVMYIGIGSHVVAVNSATGDMIWKVKLKAGMYGVTVHREGKSLYVGSNGELYCLDPASGAILWHNKLKGLGTGMILFSSTDPAASAVSAAAAAQLATTAIVVAAT
jgi:outer membrane protein assembly factor BamB